MPDANCLPPFQWRKKKGEIIPTSFFLHSSPIKHPQATEKKTTLPTTPELPVSEHVLKPPTLPKIDIQPKDNKGVASLSLASVQKKKEWEQQQKPSETKTDLPKDPFTQEELELHWNRYQEEKIKKREQNLASLFKLDTPRIKAENLLEYTVPSPLNKVELEREFVYFLPYLKKALNNFSIQIEVVVKLSEEKNFIYTPEEKYQRLKEINPALEKLRKELDLDL
ncbi:MAG: hypothetical protein ACPIB2_00775 [Flavobacteriaceae bacterium]